jgi:hypothetical protein
VAALLHAGQLVFEVHAGRTGVDHRLHQFKRVQHTAEARFGIGNDRREVVDIRRIARILALGPLDLVAALERVVDAANDLRHRVDRIERLVRVHLAGDVGVTGDLPAGQVDRFQTRLDLLHRLVAGESAERIDEGLLVQQPPQLLGTTLGQGVFDLDRPAQADHVVGRVAALDALPAGVLRPLLLQSLCFELACTHCLDSLTVVRNQVCCPLHAENGSTALMRMLGSDGRRNNSFVL